MGLDGNFALRRLKVSGRAKPRALPGLAPSARSPGCAPGRRRLAVALSACLALLAAAPSVGAQGLPLIRDTEIETLLSDYAQPIFKAAGLGGGRVQMRIIRNESFNAFVMDGRNVFVHTGTLLQSDTPNQVIGVIAHEAGHIAGGHVAALQSRLAREQTRMLLLRVLGIGVAIATGKGEAIAAADEVVIRSFLSERRSQEGAADQAGVSYLNSARQSGRGMLETFERFQSQEYVSDGFKDAFVRSHPIATDRLAQLRDKVLKTPFYDTKDPPALQLRHDLMRAKLAGYLEAPSIVANRYPVSNTSIPARYARAIARFFRGGPGALEAAIEDINGLIRDRPDYPYFQELKGDLLMRSGRPRDAVAPLRQAIRLAGPTGTLIQVQLGAALLATGEDAAVAEGAELLRRSLVTDQNPRAYRELANAQYKLGKPADADASISLAFMLEGDLKQSQIFAKRAQRGLTANSPLWIRMDDIIKAKPLRDE